MEFLVLEVDGARFGIPTADVREVLRAVRLGAPPARFPNMAGMLNYRGQVLGVLELACLRGQTHHELEPHEHLIILQSAGRLFALRVDQAVEIMTWKDSTAPDDTSPKPKKARQEDKDPLDVSTNAIAHPRLGVVYLLDAGTLWSEMHLEPSHPPAREVEAR